MIVPDRPSVYLTLVSCRTLAAQVPGLGRTRADVLDYIAFTERDLFNGAIGDDAAFQRTALSIWVTVDGSRRLRALLHRAGSGNLNKALSGFSA